MEEMTHEDKVENALNTVNITLCRIYDVMLADLTNRNPPLGRQVAETHEEGGLIGAPPSLNDDPFNLDAD